MQKVLALVGPTAIGKTDLAIALAQKLNGEIVWTTHTPKTYSDAHSIGANAKGADKLAALYESLQK